MGRRARRRSGVAARTFLLTLAIVVTVVLVGLTVTGAIIGPSLVRDIQISGLDASAAEFLNPPTGGPDKGDKPYVKGKLVLIDSKTRHIDPFWRQLPDELIARTRDEVGTIVWVDWKVDGVTVKGAGDVDVPVCRLTIIDRARNRGLGEFTFPYDYSFTDATHRMIQVRPPTVAVADYLKGLPH